MNLSFVEAFYWAVKLKSVKDAAARLFITQPAVSARITVLEKALKAPLLVRKRGKPIRLTPAGARFLADAERLLNLWSDIQTGLSPGIMRPVSLRIGAIESVLHSWLIAWIEQLRVEQPGLEFELTVETTPMLLELVRKGALDLVLAALPVHADGVRTRELPSMPMAFVGKHTLHNERKYTLKQLAQGELLTFQRGSQPHVALLDMLRKARLEKNARVHPISSISAMVRLVAGGFGVATLPHAAIAHFAAAEGLRLLPCDTEPIPLPIHVSWRTNPTEDGTDAFVESAVAFAQASGGPRPTRRRSS